MPTCTTCHTYERPSQPHGYTRHWRFFHDLPAEFCGGCGDYLAVDVRPDGTRVVYERSAVVLLASDGSLWIHTPERCEQHRLARERMKAEALAGE